MSISLIKLGFASLTLICIFFFLFGLQKTINKSDYNPDKKNRLWLFAVYGIFIWLTLVSVYSLTGISKDFSMPPKLTFVVFPPLIITMYMIFSGRADRLLKYVPHEWLIGFQTFRFFVELLLWSLYMVNLLGVHMTLEGYNWDILTGITAPVFLFAYKKFRLPKWTRVAWNFGGLALLINIVTISILSMPTPMRIFMNEPANVIMAFFPMIWLPTILVPFAYTMHFLSLRKKYIERNRL
jgi:hypothetical protein